MTPRRNVQADHRPGLATLFPWFGSKRVAAPLMWTALGDPNNVIVPFAGGLGDLLGRPTPPRREVVNDIDCFVVNFWRAVRSDPDAVWQWTDDLVSEVDLHARHRWLVAHHDLPDRLASPDYFDAQIAGWWVWGICAWIGTGWCDPKDMNHRRIPRAVPEGIHRLTLADVVAVAERLRRVIVTCGDWRRVLTTAYLGDGETGIILDPPYREGATVYAADDRTLSASVCAWAVEHGEDSNLRIVLCGYDGEHPMPPSWRVLRWKGRGGYGSQRRDGSNLNVWRERLWLSPHCLPVLYQSPLLSDDALPPRHG